MWEGFKSAHNIAINEDTGFAYVIGEAPVFAGAWTAYPFFESGTVVLNSFDSGLFVLRTGLEFDDGGDEDDGERENDRCRDRGRRG